MPMRACVVGTLQLDLHLSVPRRALGWLLHAGFGELLMDISPA